MRAFCLFIICWMAAVHAQNTGLASEWTSDTAGSIYLHQLVNLNCRGIDVPTTIADSLAYSIKFNDDLEISCIFTDFTGWVVRDTPPEGILLHTVLTDSYCETLSDTDIFSVTLNVTNELSTYPNIRCQFKDGSDEVFEPFNLPSIQVPPRSLRLDISPQTVIEGSPFSIDCDSVGGMPVSSFIYERLDGETWRELSGATYTPTIADRNGLSVRCQDTAHQNWDIPSDIIKRIEIQPAFIDYGPSATDTDQTRKFRPGTGFENYDLTCDLIGNPEVGDYIWTTDNSHVDLTVKTRRVLTLDNTSRRNGDVETITCSGAVTGIQERLTIRWIITWTAGAITTTTTTTITPEPEKSKAGLYGGIGGAIAGLVVVSVVIAVFLWRRHNGSTTKADEFAVSPHVALPQTSANHDYDLPPVERNTDVIQNNTSVRPADKMYEQLRMPVSDGVYSQPDEHLYSGLMQRTQQTEPSTGGRDNMADISTTRITDDPRSEYVNVANLTTQ